MLEGSSESTINAACGGFFGGLDTTRSRRLLVVTGSCELCHGASFGPSLGAGRGLSWNGAVGRTARPDGDLTGCVLG